MVLENYIKYNIRENKQEDRKELNQVKKDFSQPVKSTVVGEPFTLEDLAKYNGRDGNPAYVAVDGIVYDV